MSYRRPLSFRNDEKYLLDEFDSNGGSKFAKEAMRYYIKYRNKVLPDEIKVEILKLINGNVGIISNQPIQIQNYDKVKIGKLLK